MDARKRLDQHSIEFDRWLSMAFAPVSKSDLTPQKREERRKKADKNPLAFAKIYFPQIFDLSWNRMHRWIASRPPGRWTLDGFPESGKSALTYILFAIRPAVYAMGGIININNYKEPDAQRRVFDLMDLIKCNELLNYDFKIRIQRDSMTHAKINDTEIIPGSVHTGLRHLTSADFTRVVYQINDDLYNCISVRSEAMTEECMEFITGEAWRQLSSHHDTWSFMIGNTITEKAPICQLKKQFPDNHYSFPALDEHGESTWPQFRTTAEWIEFSKTLTWDMWNGEYLGKPAVRGGAFKPEWLRAPAFYINELERLVCIACHDAARGQSPHACDKALVTGSIYSSKELIIEDIYARTEPYLDFFNYAHTLKTRIPYSVLMIENDFQQWDFAQPYYEQWVQDTGCVLPIDFFLAKDLITELSSAKKEDRINYLIYPFQTGLIQIPSELYKTRDGEKFKAQYLGWPKAKPVDVLDAMATLYILGERYITTGTFKRVKSRRIAAPKWFRKKRRRIRS